MVRSRKLEDTSLWKVYSEKISQDKERIVWVEKVYEAAAAYLKDVREEFKNYTLHDETHMLNVLDAMGGLLGDWVEKLTEGELELLILAASMHDLGMVYTEEEKEYWFENERAYKDFLRTNASDWIGCKPSDWPEEIRQYYLRTLHPFRISEKLQNEAWKALFEKRPGGIISKRCMEAVCQAHGEEAKELRNNPDLEYQAASDVDPLFCAMLLRLADLLDFDDTRAPEVLYSYVAGNEKSLEEWDKHQASAGFRYPKTPSTKELPYKASCKNPTIEHAVRRFLDWVDEELENCARLQRYCNAEWQREFPFPRAVLRSEIESDGYVSGDFCYTMDQERILHLLMGENLYQNRDVFVRELLQNAIDATLLRGEMDKNFIPEESRIDFWEWMDREGNFWFRIDDQGTGMTLGMLQRYFLKVGNSYYTSQELQRDLCDHGCPKDYQGISRFGIGFLSCFLCGDDAEVSTLYFDRQKNQSEDADMNTSRAADYGLRLQVSGLKGYYTLKNQAEKHPSSPLPMPEAYDNRENDKIERQGYRAKAGTSIAIRLNPGKLGTLNLRETVEKYLCGARVPVYYNNERVGRTYGEAMEHIHELAGERVYEMSAEWKKKFDESFPKIKGNYPKLVSKVIPLDTEAKQILPDFSGVLMKYDMRFEKKPQWTDKDQGYEVIASVDRFQEITTVCLHSENIQKRVGDELLKSEEFTIGSDWFQLEKKYGASKTKTLEKKLKLFSACPETAAQLGEAWMPFRGQINLEWAWVSYLNDCNERTIFIPLEGYECLSINSVFGNTEILGAACIYQGILAGENMDPLLLTEGESAVFLLDKKWKPTVEISRSKVVELPLELLVAICVFLNKYGMSKYMADDIVRLKEWDKVALWEWREVIHSPVGQWSIHNNMYDNECVMQVSQGQLEDKKGILCISGLRVVGGTEQVMDRFRMAYLQESYFMTINYEEGQKIAVYEKKKDRGEDTYNIFPPMMFCMAASDQSRGYICHADPYQRRGITADHPFIVWLLDNQVKLNQYFQRQFQQILGSLCKASAKDIISKFDMIREQLCIMSAYYGLDVKTIPKLNREDFWPPESKENAE